MKKFDMVIIGSGAGLMVLEAALNSGAKCAIVEKSKFGGTCLNKGCIPTKMLAYPADFIREMQHAKKIGLDIPSCNTDWKKIAERMWAQIGLNQVIEKHLMGIENLTVFKGTGEFTGPKTMKVNLNDEGGSEEFEADRFVIAAGASSFVPPIKGLAETGYVVSETFFAS